MMSEQTVASTSLKNPLLIPQNPSSKPKNPSSSSSLSCAILLPASIRNHSKAKWNGCLRLKCSMDYYKDKDQFQLNGNGNSNSNSYSYSYNEVAYPKPSEIAWKKELCNSVNLIGIVAVPVEIKNFPSGKVLALTRLAVKKNATQTSWISLTFWDELAHVAFQHLEKGHQIYVSGRLVTDTVESDEGKLQTYYKVVVSQLNFIDRSQLPVSSYDRESDSTVAGSKGSYAAYNTSSTEELWQAFFANPVEWWDNRKNKKNPKYPDFKHKDTGEALWVEGRSNPPWVKSQLAILDTRMGSLTDHNARMPAKMVAADEILSF